MLSAGCNAWKRPVVSQPMRELVSGPTRAGRTSLGKGWPAAPRRPRGSSRAPDRAAQTRRALDLLMSLGRPVRPHGKAESSRGGRVIVLIPAHNEAESIGGTLRSLRNQTRRPDHVIVVCDNCSDDTPEISLRHGAYAWVTVGNTARKAGALNQALNRVLPALDWRDLVLLMDADSRLCRNWIRCATDALRQDPRLGGVCGTYTGEATPGMLGQLQRNEFVRATRLVPRRAALWVLSGTGTMFRVPVIREVARQRGRLLPGRPGEYY